MNEAQQESPGQASAGEGVAGSSEEVPFYYQMRIKPPEEPSAPPPSAEEARKLDRWISKLLFVYGSLFLMINAIAVLALLSRRYRMVVDSDALLRHSLDYSIPPLALFILFSLWLLGWSAKSRRHLALAALIAAPMFAFTGWISAVTVNGLWDKSPAVERKALVIQKYKAGGSSETVPDYFISLKSWRPDVERVDLKIHEGLYNLLEPDVSFIKVTAHPGWMGHEWIAQYARADGE